MRELAAVVRAAAEETTVALAAGGWFPEVHLSPGEFPDDPVASVRVHLRRPGPPFRTDGDQGQGRALLLALGCPEDGIRTWWLRDDVVSLEAIDGRGYEFRLFCRVDVSHLPSQDPQGRPVWPQDAPARVA